MRIIVGVVWIGGQTTIATVQLTEVPYVSPDLNMFIPPERSVDSEYPSCTLPFGSRQEDMGVCVPKEYYADQMTFCAEFVNYRTCVPPLQPLWSDWNVKMKDEVLEAEFKKTVDERIRQEMKKDQAGNYIPVKFAQNMDCIEAFKKALCWANFPSCGEDGTSFPVCRQACEHFMTACKYSDFSLCDANPYWPLYGISTQMDMNAAQCTGSAFRLTVSLYAAAVLVLVLVIN